jgi:hypothetical protein
VTPDLNPVIADVRVTNVQDYNFTVSWITNHAATGRVDYQSATEPLTSAYDPRGAGYIGETHYVLIAHVTPNTTYSFTVTSGNTTLDDSGVPFTVKTGPLIGAPGVDTIFGRVLQANGTIAPNTLVYVFVKHGAQRSQTLATFVDANGWWTLNLKAARTLDLAAYFSYIASGDKVRIEAQGVSLGTASATVDTGKDSPAPSLTLH